MLVILKDREVCKDANGGIIPLNNSMAFALIDTLAEASKEVSNYIDKHDISSSCFTGGDVYCGDELIAHVSYNGRVWDTNNKEILFEKTLDIEKTEQPSVSKNIGEWEGLNLENIELYEFMCNYSGGDFICEPTKELIKMANFIRGKDINQVDVQYKFYVGFDLYDRTVWISSSVKGNVEEEYDGYKLPLTDLDKEILLFKIIDKLRDTLIDTNQ